MISVVFDRITHTLTALVHGVANNTTKQGWVTLDWFKNTDV
jgi:hypothetical protein